MHDERLRNEYNILQTANIASHIKELEATPLKYT